MVRQDSFWGKLQRVLKFEEQAKTQAPTPMRTQPLGTFGNKSYSGYPQEEYLSTMRGRTRADWFDEMRRSDPQIKMCVNAVKNPIKSGTWEIHPGDDSAEAEQDAELIKQILFEDIDFEQFLSEALTLVEHGFSIFEPIHKAVLEHPKFGSYNSLDSLAFRSQRTIDRWNLDKLTQKLKSVSQIAYGDIGKMIDIPAEFLMVYTLEREGSNYEGISLLRSCYGCWFRKNNYLRMNAVGIERFAIPTPLVEVPDNKHGTPDFERMIEALESFVTHQKNYLFYPKGWLIDLKTSSYDPAKVEASIDAEDRRIVKNFMENFLELGMGSSGGAYALSNDLSDFFLSGIEHIAKLVIKPLNRTLIPQLIQMNRGPRVVYPKLCVSDISDKAGKELSELVKNYVDAKVIQPDDRLEEHVRKRNKLPEASEEGRRAAQPAPTINPNPDQSDPNSLVERIRRANHRRLHGN